MRRIPSLAIELTFLAPDNQYDRKLRISPPLPASSTCRSTVAMTHRCTGAGGEMGLATGFHLRGIVATLSAILVLADSSGAAMAGTTEVAGVSSRSETEWKWALNASEVRSVNVNFVRATIEILPSEGSRIEVLVTHPHDQVGG